MNTSRGKLENWQVQTIWIISNYFCYTASMFKVENKRFWLMHWTLYWICSSLSSKNQSNDIWCQTDISIVNFEHIHWNIWYINQVLFFIYNFEQFHLLDFKDLIVLIKTFVSASSIKPGTPRITVSKWSIIQSTTAV